MRALFFCKYTIYTLLINGGIKPIINTEHMFGDVMNMKRVILLADMNSFFASCH